MDQKPRTTTGYSVFQTSPAVTCQTVTSQMSPIIVSAPNTSYVLTSNNLRPVTNYTLVASSQVPVTQQYVVQSNTRTTVPQYVSTGNASHILPSTSQTSNITYMLPSGAHIVRMNNVVTTTIAGDQRSNTQFILTSSSQKSNTNIISSLGSQVPKTNNSAVSEINTPSPIFQRPGINLPKLNAAYINQIKGDESSKVAFRPKLTEQKLGTNFILTPNDRPRNKNVPISTLQKINQNYMQIPLVQKNRTILSSNSIKPNVDFHPQQLIRSIILPSNYQTTTNSTQQSTDCKLVLNSINVPTQVMNSCDNQPSSSNATVTNIQQLNTNYKQIPITQKSGTIGKQHQTVRSVFLPQNYQTSEQTPVDYRLVLKPVLKNVPVRNALPQNIPSVSQIRPSSTTSRIQNEVIANSKITPIPLKERKNKLLISERSIQLCIDEINSRNNFDDQPQLNLTEAAMELVRTEITYRLHYLLRECKKCLIKSRSDVLSEKVVGQSCAEYFTPFYGNKLWPLFCLKPNDDNQNYKDNENMIWMRKHNNVNLVGWLKHPKFRNPSYIKKRRRNNSINKNVPLRDLMKISEVLYEFKEPLQKNECIEPSQTSTHVFYQSLKDDQVSFRNLLPNINNDNNCNEMIYSPELQSFLNISETIQ